MKTKSSLGSSSLMLYNKNTIQPSPCITSHSSEFITSASVSMTDDASDWLFICYLDKDSFLDLTFKVYRVYVMQKLCKNSRQDEMEKLC